MAYNTEVVKEKRWDKDVKTSYIGGESMLGCVL